MPITRKQFELGIDNVLIDWMRKIHPIFAANKDKAYALSEICEHLNVKTFGPESYSVQAVVEKLRDLDIITSKVIRGKTYYCYNTELPEVPTL